MRRRDGPLSVATCNVDVPRSCAAKVPSSDDTRWTTRDDAPDAVAALAVAAAPRPEGQVRDHALAAVRQALFGAEETIEGDALDRSLPTAAMAELRAIGRYVLLERVGRGGMGTVVRAYDPKLRREVALKRLNADALTHDATNRLMREAQAMARLSHPCVVAVHDVELAADEVVLVMEYVRGRTLRQWLAARPRMLPEILTAFRSAGQGLAAAHRVGIAHRDFKPSNVLVAEDGSVKVTDFGLAKGLAPETAELDTPSRDSTTDRWRDEFASPLTEVDAVVGTPRYMAPEQHVGSSDERSDQYAFCVALWEALCGEPPFGARSLESLAQAKLRGPPDWPAGSKVPRRIVGAIRRGLAPSTEQRWPTMDGLLDRLLIPTSRRRAWLAGATGAVLATLGGTAAWQMQRADLCTGAAEQLGGVWDDVRRVAVREAFAKTEVSYADDTRAWAERQLDAYAATWVDAHAEACEATTIRGEQSVEVMDLRMACLHRARQELAAATQLLTRADGQVVDGTVSLLGALPSLQQCEDVDALRSAVAMPQTAQLRAQVDAIRVVLADARALHEAGRYADALAALDAWSERVETTDYALVRAQYRLTRGRALESLGDYGEAERVLREGLAEAMQVGAWGLGAELAATLAQQVGSRLARVDEGAWIAQLARSLALGSGADEEILATVWVASAGLARARGDYAEAQSMLEQAVQLRRARLGDEHPKVVSVELSLAHLLARQGDYDRAESTVVAVLELRQRNLGPDHPQIAEAHNLLGMMMLEQARYDEAAKLYRQAVSSWESTLGTDHILVAHGYDNLGLALSHQAKYAEAIELHERAHARRKALLGAEHPETVYSLNNLGMALTALGRHDEAEAVLRKTLTVREKVLGRDHPDVSNVATNLAIVLLELERYDEAEALFRRALDIWERRLGPEHPRVGGALNNVGLALANRERFAEAEAVYRRALAVWEGRLDPKHRKMGRLLQNLGTALLEQDAVDEARPLLQRAWEIREQAEDDPRYRAESAFALARATWRVDREAALRLIERARRELDGIGAVDSALEQEIDRFAARLRGPGGKAPTSVAPGPRRR